MRPLWFTHLDENRNPNLRYTALGESLSGQLLGNLEQIENLNGYVFNKMRGKILGYNTSKNQLSKHISTMERTQSSPLQIQPPTYRNLVTILSIDGGGIRGLIPATILEYLKLELQELDGESARLADYFYVITGKSTTGLVIAMLSAPNDKQRPLFTAKENAASHARKLSYKFVMYCINIIEKATSHAKLLTQKSVPTTCILKNTNVNYKETCQL